jgi:hypothetical protein
MVYTCIYAIHIITFFPIHKNENIDSYTFICETNKEPDNLVILIKIVKLIS